MIDRLGLPHRAANAGIWIAANGSRSWIDSTPHSDLADSGSDGRWPSRLDAESAMTASGRHYPS